MGVVVSLVVFFIVRWAVISWRIENKIQRLGGHAPIISAYLPLSSDFLLNTIRRAQKREDILWWQQDVMFQGTVTTAEVNPRAPCRNVFTQDPENIKAILTGQFWDYGKGKQFHAAFKDFLGDGIFATDGDLWSASRHLIRPIFARERLVDTEIFESHIQKLISGRCRSGL
ncbi:hypothetical protein KEM55_001418 [Ascosphaera atra]|nr:hypothetical protein KEM55_001418 [Ascosphaera atra]